MLAPDVAIDFLDGRHIAGWLSLLLPPGIGQGSFALLFLERGVPVKLVVSGEGEMPMSDLPEQPTSHRGLAELRLELDVGMVIALEVDAVARLMADVEDALSPGQDYAAQWLIILRALRRLNGQSLWCEPRVLDLIPPLAAEPLQRTFDLLVPDRSSMVAYCFADGGGAPGPSLAASVIAVKEGGDVTGLTTHLALADALDERALARSWQSQHREVLRLVGDRFAPPSLGVFFERGAFSRIASGPPDQLHRELARRSVIFEPMPAWLRALVGGAAVAAAATTGARALARFIPESARRAAQDLARGARERLEDSALSPFALLGFDPIELWRDLRTYYRVR
jgi:hypothetical protein